MSCCIRLRSIAAGTAMSRVVPRCEAQGTSCSAYAEFWDSSIAIQFLAHLARAPIPALLFPVPRRSLYYCCEVRFHRRPWEFTLNTFCLASSIFR